ncbi:hypothetical protein DZF98_10405, partial [Clavibacter californiensis]
MISSRGTESILTDTPENDPTRRATAAAGGGGDPFESLFGEKAAAPGRPSSPLAPRGEGPGIGTGAPMTRRELRALREAAEAQAAAPVPAPDG